MKREITFQLPLGERVTQTSCAVIVRFSGPRKTLATSALGGGLRTDLTAAFNYNDCQRAGVCEPMRGDNLLEHQRWIAEKLELDPARTAGLDTAVNMDNLAVCTLEEDGVGVSVLATAGAEANAACAGDPAFLKETGGSPVSAPAGTINLLVFLNVPLTGGALAEAMLTATEAKTALLRDLLVPSRYSACLATGTGTDGLLVACPLEGRPLYNAGKHFKLGELIGRAVRQATAEALYRQTGLCPAHRHSVLRQLERYRVTEEELIRGENPAAQRRSLEKVDSDGFTVVLASLYVHLAGQLDSGVLSPGETVLWAGSLLEELFLHYHCVPVRPPREGLGKVRDGAELVDCLRGALQELLRLHCEAEEELYGAAGE